MRKAVALFRPPKRKFRKRKNNRRAEEGAVGLSFFRETHRLEYYGINVMKRPRLNRQSQIQSRFRGSMREEGLPGKGGGVADGGKPASSLQLRIGNCECILSVRCAQTRQRQSYIYAVDTRPTAVFPRFLDAPRIIMIPHTHSAR